jgi:hypothetical protein
MTATIGILNLYEIRADEVPQTPFAFGTWGKSETAKVWPSVWMAYGAPAIKEPSAARKSLVNVSGVILSQGPKQA